MGVVRHLASIVWVTAQRTARAAQDNTRQLEAPLRAILPLLTLSAACSVSRGIRPVGEGTTAITASLGGPVVDYYGGYKPLPLSTVGVVHGLSATTDLHAALHTSTTLMFGLAGAEVGASHLLWNQKGALPAVMGDATLLGFYGNLGQGDPEGGFEPFANLALNGSWAWGKKKHSHLFYTGPAGFFQLAPLYPLGYWTVGNQFALKRVRMSVETRWIAPAGDSTMLAPDYMAIKDRGAVGLYLGFSIPLGDQPTPVMVAPPEPTPVTGAPVVTTENPWAPPPEVAPPPSTFAKEDGPPVGDGIPVDIAVRTMPANFQPGQTIVLVIRATDAQGWGVVGHDFMVVAISAGQLGPLVDMGTGEYQAALMTDSTVQQPIEVTVISGDGTAVGGTVVPLRGQPVPTAAPVTEQPWQAFPTAQPPVAQPPVAQPPVAQPPVAQPPVAQPPEQTPEDEGQQVPSGWGGAQE